MVASTATTDPVNADDSASVDFTVRAASDDAISKTGDATLTAGDTFSYQITAATAGPSDARDVTVTDALPATLVLESVTTAQGSCTVAGQTITCDLGTIPAPAGSVVITITGHVRPDTTGTVTNTATLSTSTPDPNPGNDSSTATADLISSADLSVAKEPDSSPLIAGATVGYTITVTNQGPSNASGVVLTDVLPAAIGFDPMSSDPACALAAGGVTCTIGTLPADDTRVFRVVGQLSPSFLAPDVTNVASVTSTTPDPDATNDEVSVTTPVATRADLDVTKLPSTQTPAAGETLTYTLTVANLGLSDAQAVTLSDSMPAGTTFVSATGDPAKPCSAVATTVTCDVGVLAAGASQTMLVTVRLSSSLPPQTLTNTATADSATRDPVAGNNSATAAVQSAVIADLSVTKALVTPTPLVAGQPVTYTITVHNAGPSDAPDALFSDTLPPGTSLLSASAEQGSCGLNRADALTIVACELGTLPAGDSVSGTLTLATSPDLTGSLANTASTGSGALDPDATNNTSTATAEIARAPQPSSPSTSPPIAPQPPSSPSSAVASGGTLAFTGLDVRAYLLLAAVLLAAGAALLQIGRHRRRRE